MILIYLFHIVCCCGGGGGRFNFWAKDGKAVMFMTETQIKAQEAKDFKDRQAKRARAKVRRARRHGKAQNVMSYLNRRSGSFLPRPR